MFEHLKRFFRGSRVLEAPEAYRRWAADYPARPHTALMELEQSAMLQLLPSLESLETIDLGCGSGRYLKLLKERGAARVTGLDLSSEMLHEAFRVSPNLIQADLEALPLPSQAFDLAICGLAVGHLSNLKKYLSESARILRPGGFLLYSDLHPFAGYLGWKRQIPGTHFEVRYHTHLYADHHRVCRSCGLEIEEVLEPHIPFEHPFQEWPAVLVLRARRAT